MFHLTEIKNIHISTILLDGNKQKQVKLGFEDHQ